MVVSSYLPSFDIQAVELCCSDVDSTHAELDWRLWNIPVLRRDQPLLHSVHLDVLPWYVKIPLSLLIPETDQNVSVETKGRTLEELDVVFAKAYTTKEWYVKVAAELPKLSMSEIDAEATKWGIGGVIAEKSGHQKDSATSSQDGITDEGAARKV